MKLKPITTTEFKEIMLRPAEISGKMDYFTYF